MKLLLQHLQLPTIRLVDKARVGNGGLEEEFISQLAELWHLMLTEKTENCADLHFLSCEI
jgi:hypothetical protein